MIDNESPRRVARFNLSIELLAQVLQLPDGAIIERMHRSNDFPNALTIVLRHPDFRKVHWGEFIPVITPLAHYDESNRLVVDWKLESD